MSTTNNTTTKTSHGVKGLVTKGYVKSVNCAAHTVTLVLVLTVVRVILMRR